MPDLLPQLGPQPAPAPSKPSPASVGNSPVAQRTDPDSGRDTESFADAYDAAESDEAPAPPPAGTDTETSDEVPVPVAVVPAATTGIYVTSETETPLVESVVTAATAGTREGEETATPAKSAPTGREVAVPVPLRGEARAPVTPFTAEAAGETPKGVQPNTMPASEDAIARVQPATQATLPQDVKAVEGAKQPIIDTIDTAPEPELELPLPERIGPRQAASPVQQNIAQALTAMQQPQVQAAGPAEAGIAPLDEVLPAGPQGTGTGAIFSPTAPGAAPAQIAQHAAGQIVAALPRDQGVFITDAGTEIALDPPELGRVRMIVTEIAGGLALTVTAERPETLDLFRRHASMLAGEFAREGFANTNFAFEGNADGDGRNPDSEDGPVLRIAADPQDLINGITPQLTQGGGLDVRL